MRLQLAAPDRNGALLPGAKTAWGGGIPRRGRASLAWIGRAWKGSAWPRIFCPSTPTTFVREASKPQGRNRHANRHRTTWSKLGTVAHTEVSLPRCVQASTVQRAHEEPGSSHMRRGMPRVEPFCADRRKRRIFLNRVILSGTRARRRDGPRPWALSARRRCS